MSQINTNDINFRQYLHSFQSPLPTIPIQSFGQQGYAPYGNVLGTNPELIVPSPQIQDGPQPVYHVKVTATPIHVSKGTEESPEYVVTAYPDIKGQQGGVITKGGQSVVAHASPDLSGANARGLSIRPLIREKPGSSKSQELSSQIVNRQLGGMPTQAPSSQPGALEESLVHVYSGDQAAATQKLLMTSPPIADMQRGHPYEAQEASKGGLIGSGYSRAVPRPLDVTDFEAEQRSKMYSWIIPTSKGMTSGMTSKFFEESEKKEGAEIGRSSGESDVDRLLMQASMAMTGRETEGEAEEHVTEDMKQLSPETRIVSTPTDDELGLPHELRPSILYGGVEHAQPEFAGQKGALKYKLHAVEVHQYVPIPDAKEPWLIKNNMNPATSAIFGPMPMPFDPSHSGMVAPTFQKTIGLQPTPVLSPEVAKMFSHELPVITNLLDVTPGAEASA